MPLTPVPEFSLGPLVSASIHAFLALQALGVRLFFRDVAPVPRPGLTYLSIAFYFAGLVGIGYQTSESAVVWWARISLLGLTWLPVSWIWFMADLEFRPLSRTGRAVLVWAVVTSVILLAVDHPAVVSGPLRPSPAAGVALPRSWLVRPIIYAVNIAVASVYAAKMFSAWLNKAGRPVHALPVAVGLAIWILAGLHDTLYNAGLFPYLSPNLLAIGSIWLSLFLSMAQILSYQALRRDLDAKNEALVRSRQLAALGAIAAMVAHQVGGFLNKLVFALSVVRAERLSRDSLDTLEAIERSAVSLNRFTKRFLTAAKKPHLASEPVVLDHVLERALAELETTIAAKGVEVVVTGQAGLEVVGDWVLLQQAFLGLLTNAVEAVGEAGRIEVSAAGRDGLARIEIADNGPGMSPRQQADAFVPFATDKGDARGLGLSMAKMIIEAHGGTIALTSRPGSGTVVGVMLPTSGGRSRRRPADAETPSPERGGGRFDRPAAVATQKR